MKFARILTIAAVVGATFLSRPVSAVTTGRWELHTSADFMRGKLERLTVSSDGQLRLGYESTKLGEFAKEIWCSTVGPDGTIYFGTGSPADVYAVGKDDTATKLFETDAIAVTALALDSRGNLYAATMAEGKIFKMPPGRDKQGAEFCKLRAPYVWSLAIDKQGNLFAGTGPDGKLYRISSDGKAEEWFATEESNLLSLAFDADGALLAGGSDRGLLYKISAKNSGVVLHQFDEDEVKSLVWSNGNLYIGVNKQKVRRPRGPAGRRPSAGEFEDLTQQLSSQFGARQPAEAAGSQRETPPEARLANLLSGALYVRNADGRVDKIAGWDNESVSALTVDAEGGLLAAMAGAGRVYRVPDDQHWELLFDFDTHQALTLAMRDGRLAFVGTGNVGNAYVVDGQRAAAGEFTSEVRDSRFLTTWGNLSWMGSGTIAASTRTGNTALPDSTWSDWSAPIHTSPGKVGSPRARFIQLRLRLSSASKPVIEDVNLYYQIQNQKPDLSSVDVGERPKPVSDKSKPDTSAAKPEEGTGADAIAAAAAMQSPAVERKPEELRPKPATTTQRISWHATDKDGDTLVYRLFYQAQDDDLWVPMPLDKPLKKTEYTWQTDSIPDGWYQIKVVASDEESNPAGAALTDEKTSNPEKVDNRRPEVVELAFQSASTTITGVARDNLSLIRFLEYSVDGGEWKFFAPKDGVFDDREEAFEVEIGPLPTGPHYIAVRATDEEGNVGAEKIFVK